MSDNIRVFLACKPVDMRLGAPGLCAAVRRVFQANPLDGHLYVFRSRKGDYTKCVYFDGSGVCVFAEAHGAAAYLQVAEDHDRQLLADEFRTAPASARRNRLENH